MRFAWGNHFFFFHEGLSPGSHHTLSEQSWNTSLLHLHPVGKDRKRPRYLYPRSKRAPVEKQDGIQRVESPPPPSNEYKLDEHLFIGGREKTTFRLKRHQLHEKTKMTKRNQSTTAGSRLVFGHSDRFTLGWEATKDQRATNPTSSWLFVVGRSSSVTGNGRVLSGQSIRNRIDGDYVVFLVGEIY
jgi:hypothetical protein